jgi:hypothetical protein
MNTNNQTVNTGVEYYKWVNSDEQLTYVGVLTMESDTHFSLLTNQGEMTFPKGDGVVSEATREEFEQNQQVTTPTSSKTIKVKSVKLVSNKAIVSDLIRTNQDLDKKDLIDLIVVKLNVTKSNASVYYYNAIKANS